ncbi:MULTISPECIES: lipoprotein-releasing ABC transporter permease subunit LolE [unclassified Vibrio]|uniref:Lipoprotein-releasing ABC transporter permease subunit LolE n=1 Tax=Vibrio sp. HB236076 TaxID=3232307 RepID=A0AB39HG46_9VIBR|nr:lipoprotein-releasing ABC transporter permease subunit LolE [Vibrio sp. HB161653]MDP5255109.1 lipoprotein-releasing ABC transporter permease subunit LolE [Vibrio sp. HB161653]
MINRLAWQIGFRFSRAKARHKLVSFISVSSTIGIAIGVAVVIIGLSAMNGFQHELEKRVLSVIPHAELEGVQGPIDNWSTVVKESQQVPHIVAAAPYVRFTGLAEKGTQLKAIEIRGVDAKLEERVSDLAKFIDKPAWNNFVAGQQQVILGQGVAEKLKVKKGDYITLMIPKNNHQDRVEAPQRVRVQVSGLLRLEGQIDHNLALIPLKDAQAYNSLGQGVTGVALRTTSPLQADQIVRQVGHHVSAYVYLRTWQQKFGFLYRDIQMVRTIMYLVMVLVIGVACFNIVSTLMMAVKDRASDIAILRTMGAQDRLIRTVFTCQGLLSGLTGSVLGSAVGVLLATQLTTVIHGLETMIGHRFLSGDIYFVDFLPSQVHGIDVVVVCITALILSLVATWYPARRATNLNPATVLSGK